MPLRKPTLSYEETRKQARQRRGLPEETEQMPAPAKRKERRPKTVETKAERRQAQDAPKTASTSRETTTLAKTITKTTSNRMVDKQIIRFCVPYLRPGISVDYDAIVEAYDTKTALSTMTKRALQHFNTAEKLPAFTRKTTLYASTNDTFVSNRSVPVDVLERIREVYDPLGVKSDLDIGKTFGHALLTFYLQHLSAE